ncbi:MAG: hypothetical protein GY810_11735 [Aureispira sp.]|nr:hypothetical protein [Aureispira sp.]
MINSKFIQLYQALSKAEYKQLQKWVNSPIHNQHKIVQNLFNYLYSRTVISKTTVDKNRIFQHLYPNEVYNDNQLYHIQSYSIKVLENFLGYNRIFSDQNIWQKALLQEYRSRNQTKLSQQTLEKAKNTLAKEPLNNASYHLDAYHLEVEQFKLGSIEKRTAANNLPQLFEHLSSFFILTTLKYACTAVSHSNVSKTAYTIPFLETVLQAANSDTVEPSIKIYYYAYKALTQVEQEENYTQLKQYFFEYNQLLNSEEQYEVFQLMINYCIKQINTSNQAYFKEIFELYKKGLETKILLGKTGALSRFTYKNIVSAGLQLQQFKWIQNFIAQYTNYLPKPFQRIYTHYSNAKLFFVQKNYTKALQLLVQVEDYDDIFMTLGAKMMLLKIYYEENSIDSLMALISSFRVFLQRKDILGYHRKVYQNILSILNKLLNIAPTDKIAKKQLLEVIQTTQPLAEKQWLLNQLQKL